MDKGQTMTAGGSTLAVAGPLRLDVAGIGRLIAVLWAAGYRVIGPTAVSYTHLDVYKRQV